MILLQICVFVFFLHQLHPEITEDIKIIAVNYDDKNTVGLKKCNKMKLASLGRETL